MISLSSDIKVMVAIEPIDFRAGINRLASLAMESFQKEAMDGILFAFRNKKKTDIKFLWYDGNGFFLGHKRLSKGKLKWWPRTKEHSLGLSTDQFIRLLYGIDPRSEFHPDWEELQIGSKRRTDHHYA